MCQCNVDKNLNTISIGMISKLLLLRSLLCSERGECVITVTTTIIILGLIIVPRLERGIVILKIFVLRWFLLFCTFQFLQFLSFWVFEKCVKTYFRKFVLLLVARVALFVASLLLFLFFILFIFCRTCTIVVCSVFCAPMHQFCSKRW